MSTAIPFTGLAIQAARLRPLIDRNIAQVLDHGQFIMGPEVAKLEDELKTFCGARNAISCANGTDALQIALMATGIGAGDRVYVPSFTYTATAEVILLLGARPVFVDVDATTFNIDCDNLERHMAADAGQAGRAAIIAVDLFGLPAEWAQLNALATRFDAVLIADAAQSFGGATAEGKRVGALAPITTTSFFPAKPLGCYGDGGAIFVEDDLLAGKMRSIRVHGQGKAKYETVRTGVNSRLDTLQAAVLLAKLTVFGAEIAQRNKLADRYADALDGMAVLPAKPAGVTSAWAQYTIRVADRDGVQQRLKDAGVPTAVYYPLPMHLQPAYRAHGGGEGSLPVSEALSAEVLSLPMNPYWEAEEVSSIAAALEGAVSGRSMAASQA